MIKKVLIFLIMACATLYVVAHAENINVAPAFSVTNAELDINETTVIGRVTVVGSADSYGTIYAAVYNIDHSLSSVQAKDIYFDSSLDTTIELNFNFPDLEISKGMYAVCYVWDLIKPLCECSAFNLPNSLEYGSYVFEAESIITSDSRRSEIVSESDASGGEVIYFRSHVWSTEKPVSDGTSDDLRTTVNVPEGKSGVYKLWFRYKILPNSQSSAIWYRYNDIQYTRNTMNYTIDGVYRWASITLNLNEGENLLAFASGVPSHIDKFILTSNIDFVPSGIDDRPEYVTDEMLELGWASLLEKPPVVPIEGHPRLYVTPEFIPTLKENLKSSENSWMYEKFKNKYAYEELNCKFDTTLPKNYNSILLVKIMSRALVYMLGDETDINHAKQTISYMRDYLNTVRTPNDEGDITRTRGNVLVAAAVVYDWCYDALTKDDKEYFKKEFIKIAASKEIGWPPKNMSSIASHAGEQEIFRDLLAAGIAIYDEYPLYYNMTAGRMFEELIPARQWLRKSGRFEIGNDYAECRGYSEMWAAITFKRMGYDINLYGDAKSLPFRWLIHSRMPYGAMMPSGDMYTITHSNYQYYDRNYALTELIASTVYDDSVLKQEFLRSFNLAYAGDDIQFWYCLFNDPSINGEIWKDEPLAKETIYPFSSVLHKTSHQEGFDSDAAIGFMNMHEIYVGDHQNIYTGDFQIYYKGLLAMNTGTYNASTQHNQGYQNRAIAGNTMLCYNPDETFVPTWSNVNVPNDGGQRTPYLNADGTSRGSVVGQLYEYEIDENGFAQNDDLIVSKNVKTYIGPNEKTPLYSYISGDLTNAYSDKVTSYKRSMVFADLANDTYPAAFVVYDKMSSSNASFKKTWLMHSQQKPSIEENKITITRTGNGFDGKLVDTVLLPQNHTINVVGGENNEMFVVGGLSMPPEENTIEGGNYRIELSPSGENIEDKFLNVMYVTSASGNAPELSAQKVETELFVGATIYDRLILFGKEDMIDSEFTLSLESENEKTYVLIADVKEGTWNIASDDISMNIESKHNENVIFAELPNGRFTFSLTSDAPDNISYPELSKRALGDFMIWKYVSKADVNIATNGNFIYQAKPTILKDGIPCVALETLLQFEAEYTYKNNLITINKNSKTMLLTLANTNATINEASKALSTAPFTKNSTAYVPITDLLDFLGYEFSYNNETKVLEVNPK